MSELTGKVAVVTGRRKESARDREGLAAAERRRGELRLSKEGAERVVAEITGKAARRSRSMAMWRRQKMCSVCSRRRRRLSIAGRARQ